jgi:hypothetical protein
VDSGKSVMAMDRIYRLLVGGRGSGAEAAAAATANRSDSPINRILHGTLQDARALQSFHWLYFPPLHLSAGELSRTGSDGQAALASIRTSGTQKSMLRHPPLSFDPAPIKWSVGCYRSLFVGLTTRLGGDRLGDVEIKSSPMDGWMDGWMDRYRDLHRAPSTTASPPQETKSAAAALRESTISEERHFPLPRRPVPIPIPIQIPGR